MTKFIGLIPAAGKGTRVGFPFPKELYPIVYRDSHKVAAEFTVDRMIEASIDEIVFVVNETKHQLMNYFGSGLKFGCKFSYVFQDTPSYSDSTKSSGMIEAINSAYHITAGKTVFFGMPDTIITPHNYFLGAYRKMVNLNCNIALITLPTSTPSSFGMVSYDENSIVDKVIDKPRETNLKEMWGAIVWQPIFTNFINYACQNGMTSLDEIFKTAIKQGFGVCSYSLASSDECKYTDLGTHNSIFNFNKELA